ncbi:hypothetical protein Tsubulata_044822 [Turnera subulata]|uniref:Cyclic nucleotide-binding domain-containing protein n=1 Tax=Turnera subulata TaxID=218843 RepID=A0A9Q0FBA6_9ROSI|nr:hypothetical protein Tsubulata_044822 [Turnera subulata]
MGGPAQTNSGGDSLNEDEDDHEQVVATCPGLGKQQTMMKDMVMQDLHPTYLEKLKSNTSENQEDHTWQAEEEETHVEPGDIIIGQDDLANNFFVVKFENKKDYLHSLVGGPWAIFNSALCVFPWNPDFNPASNRVDKAVVWVRFPDIPLHTYHTSILHALGDLVGQSIRIDHATREHQRGRFAKIAVEVDLTKPLKGTIRFRGEAQKVIYEGLPILCYQCRSASHSMDRCPDLHQTNHVASTEGNGVMESSKGKEVMNTLAATLGSSSSGAGEWMNAPVRQRRNQQKKQSPTQTIPAKIHNMAEGSRFQVLARDLDKDGGLEEAPSDGPNPWIPVTEKKGSRTKKTQKQPQFGNPQPPQPSKTTTRPTPQTINRPPLAEITNQPPHANWVPKSPQNSPLLDNTSASNPAFAHHAQTTSSSQTVHTLAPQSNHPTLTIPTLKGHHTVVPSDSTSKCSVISRQEADLVAELSRGVPPDQTIETSPLQRTRTKIKPPDLNPIDTGEPQTTQPTKNATWNIVLRKAKSPLFKKRGKKGGLGPGTAEDATFISDEEMESTCQEEVPTQVVARGQDTPTTPTWIL